MSARKYIAAGFIDDAKKLFIDFAKCPNHDFKTFCNVWRSHKFGYIFMGRPHYKELREFTSVIYQLTLNYMISSSLDSQIAAIYLLYALYRSQDVISPVMIRISKLQFQVLQHVHAYAAKEKVYTLHYIIDYLKKNCLEFVANCTLYGPCCSRYQDNPAKSKADQLTNLSDLKQNMTIFSDSFQNLTNMHSQYLKRKNSTISVSGSTRNNYVSNGITDYEEKTNELKVLLEKGTYSPGKTANSTSGPTAENDVNITEPAVKKSVIGCRRSELKFAAMKVMPSKYLKSKENTQETENKGANSRAKDTLTKKRNYIKRVSANERRLGRPRKYAVKRVASDENESDDSDFNYSFKILPKEVAKVKGGKIGRRNASYLRNYEGPIILTPKQRTVDDYSEISDESIDDILQF